MSDASDGGPLVRALTEISDRVAFTEDWIVPLRAALEGVGAAEAAWKPAPDERSIAEIANHARAWTEWAAAFLDGRDTDVTDWPPVADPGEAAWAESRRALDAALAALHRGIAALPPDGLFAAPTPEVTRTSRLMGVASILVHNAYHAGQITKLRERYRAQAGGTAAA